jgi:hypothetical protein
MTVLAQLLIAAALVATAVIYGTDVFAAIVLRPALAHVDDCILTGATGCTTTPTGAFPYLVP